MSLDSEESTKTVLLKTKEASDNLSKENWDNLFKESLDNNLSQLNVEENKRQATFVTEMNRDVKEVLQQPTLTIWTLTKHLPWWRHLEDVFKTSFVFVFRRRLQDVFKRFWSRRIYSPESKIFRSHTSSRRLQDVFKMFSRRLQDVFKTSCQDVFKTLSRRLQDVMKTYSRHLSKRLQDIFKMSSGRFEDVLQRYFQYFFKMYHQVKLFLLTSFQDVFERY